MDVLSAAADTVHEFPGGSDAVAAALQKSGGALRRELKGAEGNKLGLVDASRIMRRTGDYRILHALAAEHGMVAVPVGDAGEASDILSLMLEKQTANGELASEVKEALADGRITANELSRLRSTFARQQAVLDRMYRHLLGMHQADMPGAVVMKATGE